MKSKKTLIILGVILVALIAAIVVISGVKKHEDTVTAVEEEVFSLEPDAVENVSWDYEGETLTFAKEDGTWKDPAEAAFPVNQEKLQDLLEEFESVSASFIIENVEDYGQYGLDSPECTISFDEDKQMSFGDFSVMDNERYISVNDGNVYLIEEDLLTVLSSSRDDYIRQDGFKAYDEINTVEISGDRTLEITGETTEDEETGETKTTYTLQEDGEEKELSESRVQSYLDSVLYLDLTEYATYEATEDILSDYGLDEPCLTISVTGMAYVETEEDEEDDDAGESLAEEDYSVEELYTEEDTEEWETEASSETISFGKLSDDEIYARMGESEIIYKVDPDTFLSIYEVSYDTLRPEEVVSQEVFENAKQLILTDGDQSYTVDVNREEEENVYTSDGEAVAFSDAETAILAMTINEFANENTGDALELSLTVKAKDSSTEDLTVEFYSVDGDDCFVVINGEAVGLMDRSLMTQVRDAFEKAVLNKGKEVEEESEEELYSSYTDEDLYSSY